MFFHVTTKDPDAYLRSADIGDGVIQEIRADGYSVALRGNDLGSIIATAAGRSSAPVSPPTCTASGTARTSRPADRIHAQPVERPPRGPGHVSGRDVQGVTNTACIQKRDARGSRSVWARSALPGSANRFPPGQCAADADAAVRQWIGTIQTTSLIDGRLAVTTGRSLKKFLPATRACFTVLTTQPPVETLTHTSQGGGQN